MSTLTPIVRPRWLPREQWPFPATALTTTTGQRIAVTDFGAGPTLLFVHVGGWSFIWRDLLLELADEYRCVTVDAPGSGQSSQPTGRVSLHGAADAVEAVIDALDLRTVTLVMHDVGGPVGLAAAAERSDRIAGLVSLNALGWRPTGARLRSMLAVMGSAPARETGAFGWSARLSSSSFGAGRHWTKKDKAVYMAGLDRTGRRNTHRYLNALRTEDDVLRRVEAALTQRLSTLPLLTVFGSRNDPFGFGPRWQQLFPHAEQHIIPGGNHYPMNDDPQKVAELIRRWHTAQVLHVDTYSRVPQPGRHNSA
jgi:pimeloyl-ACP methyl ester carboxylesterase